MQPVLLPSNLGRLEAQQELMSASQNCPRGSRKCGGGRYLRIRMPARCKPEHLWCMRPRCRLRPEVAFGDRNGKRATT